VACKDRLADGAAAHFAPLRDRRRSYEEQPERLHEIMAAGCARAREVAQATMARVREAMNLG
jgi:tryptophanyl-tRNA synthetase